jgi:ATP-dependent DNA helicase RecG
MKPSLDKLIKFIKLEAERGYDNKAVVGGLDKIYSSWEAEARAESIPEELIQAVGARLRDYSQLTPQSRADMLQGLWRRIQRSSSINLPSLPPAPERNLEEDNAGGVRTTPRPEQHLPEQGRQHPRQGQRPAQPAGQQSGARPRPAGPPSQRQGDKPEPVGSKPEPVGSKYEPRAERPGGEKPRQTAGGRPETARPAPQRPERTERPQQPKPHERREQPRAPGGESRPSPTAARTVIPVDAELDRDFATETPAPSVEQEFPRVIDEASRKLIEEGPRPAFRPTPVQAPAQPPTPRPAPGQRTGVKRAPRPVFEGAPAALNAPVTVLPGVGPRHGETIGRLGLFTLGDMLYFFPRRYLDYSQLRPINRLFFGEEVTVLGVIESVSTRQARGGKMQLVEAIVSDGSGSLRVTWFNQPWLGKRLHSGIYVSLSGKIDQYLGRLAMNNPELEQLDQEHLHTNRIVPVYPLTANITQRWLRGILHQVISYWSQRVQDPLPDSICDSAELLDLPTALFQAHFPDSWEMLEAARHRLAFDEIFLLQLGVLSQKRAWQERSARVFESEPAWTESQYARLPYSLTNAQQRAVQDILNDLKSGRPMNRLLQGDVGAGKTIVAALAMALIAQHGAQSAIMAPTSILAEQHYQNLRRLLCPAEGVEDLTAPLQPHEIRLLVGATPEPEKEEIRAALESGQIKIVIGTHALIEDPVNFADLELVVIDEQHRFGVQQRSLLRSKGRNPHLLVMTATPIPRSLALTVYGDLDLSILDEMPPGRQPIETQVFFPAERERAYSLVRSQIERGYQAFMIYPLVEETENSEAMAAVEEHARLQKEVFPKLRLGLLHGRMKGEEKDAVMADFRDGNIHILVSTSVVEVGVDVPNATVMVIEGANRFGLAQLHQFRGRVGRGEAPSFCVLIPDQPDAVENERLSAMLETNDGFILAERDLQQRGPGDFLGTRQSGYHSELRLASLTDIRLIEKARRHAQQVFIVDPELARPEHKSLGAAVARFWDTGQGDIS